ncbi:MAG TPA: aminotransferase class I/II-fold pyridoxal phosphate-dependent enzyme, partial [Gemmatimonadales bacterium]|nr:aminotransferase class I/II-fold pyridoxal phosphate-dependent enzyme [Gemmatimonadales bacterium]
MISFSKRVQNLPGYPLAEIPAIKRRLMEAGVDVIDLGAGDNDTPPPEVAVETMGAALRNPALSKYGFQQGLPEFRQAASRW